MNLVGVHRYLPAKPGTGIHAQILQRNCKQPDRDLFAGGDDGVIFSGIVHRADITRPSDELVCRACHGGNDDSDAVTGVDLGFHP